MLPQIKYIADPGMHSIPSVAVHPNGKWLCGQSLDNQIVTYSALDKFRINRKKVFKGHTNSGYACQVGAGAFARKPSRRALYLLEYGTGEGISVGGYRPQSRKIDGYPLRTTC